MDLKNADFHFSNTIIKGVLSTISHVRIFFWEFSWWNLMLIALMFGCPTTKEWKHHETLTCSGLNTSPHQGHKEEVIDLIMNALFLKHVCLWWLRLLCIRLRHVLLLIFWICSAALLRLTNEFQGSHICSSLLVRKSILHLVLPSTKPRFYVRLPYGLPHSMSYRLGV